MPKYRLRGMITLSVGMIVEAENEEDAKEKADIAFAVNSYVGGKVGPCCDEEHKAYMNADGIPEWGDVDLIDEQEE